MGSALSLEGEESVMTASTGKQSRKKKPLFSRIGHLIDYEAENGCWEFHGYIMPTGYGQVWDGVHRNALAHRAVFEAVVGPIPEGLHLDHICRNTICVNPEHLEPVTMKVNILRGEGPSALIARTGKCLRGHDLVEGNLYYHPHPKKPGRRECLTCRVMRQDALNVRRREATRARRMGLAA